MTAYGLTNNDKGWETVAKLLNGTQGGDLGWFNANNNNLTMQTDAESILTAYDRITELEQKASEETAEG